MNILFVCKLKSTKGNGVIYAMLNEIKYLQDEVNVGLFSLGVEINNQIIGKEFNIKDYDSIESLPVPYNKPDLVVFEEVYKIEYIKLYKYCVKNKIPYVIIPHGCLVGGAQKRKWWKKIPANILLFNKFISSANAVQFLNSQEKELSKFNIKRTIEIPNGFEIFNNSAVKLKNTNKFTFLFIGRYDVYHKGLDILVDSFLELKDWCKKNMVCLELYGVIENKKEIDKLIKRIKYNDMCDVIKINGPIYGEDKEEKIKSSNVFVLTSRLEGQPMGIIEALAYGLPCVVTLGTSFKDYCNEKRCGIGVNFDKEEIKEAIKRIVIEKENYNAYVLNAKKCFIEDFDLKKITEETKKIYLNLINS